MAPSGPELPPKKEVALALLERASVFVHLDPRGEDVRVPKWFKKQPQLVLQIGLNMPVPIPDLSVEEDAVSCTLSFSRSPFFCYVPWKVVYALVGEDGRGMVWPDDVPREVAAQASPSRGRATKNKPGLRVVGGGEGEQRDEPGGGSKQSEQNLEADGADATGSGKIADLAKHRSSRAEEPPGAPAEPEPAAAGAEPLEPAQPRPALAAVEDADDGDDRADAEEPGDDPDDPDDKKRKRDLPSYLRVVK